MNPSLLQNVMELGGGGGEMAAVGALGLPGTTVKSWNQLGGIWMNVEAV